MLYRMPGRPWFANLKKGLPPRPLTWEGWAFMGAYVAGLASFAHAARVFPPYHAPPLIGPFVIGAALLSGCFMVFCWLKSEELPDASALRKPKIDVARTQDDKDRDPPSRWI